MRVLADVQDGTSPRKPNLAEVHHLGLAAADDALDLARPGIQSVPISA